MRIGIDARFLTHPQRGGFKTYTENLIGALAEIDAENEYILYLDRSPDRCSNLPQRPNFLYHVVKGHYPLIGMPWREQISLTFLANRDKLDLLHSPCQTAPLLNSCASVVTIHDMIWLFPEKYSRSKPRSLQRNLMERYYRVVSRLGARKSSLILTVSKASRDDIVRYLDIPADNIFVTYEAASGIYRQVNDIQQIDSIRRKYNLSTKFIMAVGSADPRKNISTLVQAYALLPQTFRENHHLVIVWAHQFLEQEISGQIEKLKIGGYVKFLTNVSNEDLVLLYNAASLFVFPSLYEGFGLPLLEAMACGTPVVTVNNSSIPEIVGDAALLFGAEDAPAIANAMAEVSENDDLRKEFTEKGLQRAREFSWEECGLATLAVYRKAISRQNLRNKAVEPKEGLV